MKKPQWLININDKRLLLLNTEVRKRAYFALTELENDYNIFCLVLETDRSISKQAYYYSFGRSRPGPIRTNAKPGWSFHHYLVALDVAPLDINFKCDWSKNETYKKVGEVFKKHGFEWGSLKKYGGDFNTIDDWPHMQMRFGLTIRDFIAGKIPPIQLDDQQEFVFALERLKVLKIISSPDYWLQTLLPGKKINYKYVRIMIINFVKFINKNMNH